MLQSLDPSLQPALISAGAALLGALIGAAATILTTWVNKKLQTSGKVTLYAKIVYSKAVDNRPWGYYQGENDIVLEIPLWLDIVNTSGISRVVRNVNLYAYINKSEVAEFTQIQRIGKGESAILLGDHGAYTLVAPANSSRRFEMEFLLKKSELPPCQKEFDKLILSYFDEKDKIHAFHFEKINSCWVLGPLDMTHKWFKLDRKCKYARQ